jgi:hypothetical protein
MDQNCVAIFWYKEKETLLRKMKNETRPRQSHGANIPFLSFDSRKYVLRKYNSCIADAIRSFSVGFVL